MSLVAAFGPHWERRSPTDPVLLLMHGYGSNERDLPSLVPHLPGGLQWASVRAPLAMGYGGYAWFPLEDNWLDPEPIAAATDLLWEWIDTTVGAEAPLLVVGFSQGGLMGTQLLRTRPERVAKLGILGGFALNTPQGADARLAESRPAVFWGRGTADTVIPAAYVEMTREFLEAHTTLTERAYPRLGHSVSTEELADLKAYLS